MQIITYENVVLAISCFAFLTALIAFLRSKKKDDVKEITFKTWNSLQERVSGLERIVDGYPKPPSTIENVSYDKEGEIVRNSKAIMWEASVNPMMYTFGKVGSHWCEKKSIVVDDDRENKIVGYRCEGCDKKWKLTLGQLDKSIDNLEGLKHANTEKIVQFLKTKAGRVSLAKMLDSGVVFD